MAADDILQKEFDKTESTYSRSAYTAAIFLPLAVLCYTMAFLSTEQWLAVVLGIIGLIFLGGTILYAINAVVNGVWMAILKGIKFQRENNLT